MHANESSQIYCVQTQLIQIIQVRVGRRTVCSHMCSLLQVTIRK